MENEKDLIEKYREAVKEKKTLEIALAKAEEVGKVKKEDFENKKKALFEKYSVSTIEEIKKIRNDKLSQMSALVTEIKKDSGDDIG